MVLKCTLVIPYFETEQYWSILGFQFPYLFLNCTFNIIFATVGQVHPWYNCIEISGETCNFKNKTR